MARIPTRPASRDREPSQDRGPWRVEGRPQDAPPARQRRRLPGWLWLLLVALLAVNWLLMSQLTGGPRATSVSYSFFYGQVRADNVSAVTSTDSQITGTFATPVGYPPGGNHQVTVTRFSTQRPAFANDRLV